jgi:serine/threonine-protein kinase
MTELRDQLEAALGTTYVLERELGGGGMSRVFLAVEQALSRRVVIKVLPPEMAASVSMDRFRREIMFAARLQNPHIIPLLSAGEAGGLPYLTMPFVDGESLRVRLARGGELPVAEGLRILREVATALDYAHQEGIVHRDIKPENILLSHGSAMVTDFGVAKAISASSNAEHSGVTSHGVALGTPAYMSPEQAAAAPGIDARADVYAFGVLAYELFAGRPPFEGRSPPALLAAHVSEVPEPIQKLRPSLPSALSALIMRCLEKRPADRPQRASEIVHALDAITTPSGGSAPTLGLPSHATSARSVARRRILWIGAAAVTVLAIGGALVVRERLAQGKGVPVMLAVLPFENQGPASEDYFGDGLADAITSRLASVPTLGVIAQRSAGQYKHSSKPLNQIGRELGVQYVLQATVRWAGAGTERKAQISPELVRVSDGTVRWAAEPYVVAPADVFAVQSDIAAR